MSAQQIDKKKLERAIRKIKHCLTLAQSANENENENEAATALRQAQTLMREYRLTEMDVKLSDVGEVESQFTRAERLFVWERSLAGAVANVFGCTSLYARQYCKEKDRIIARTSFVGVTPAQHITLNAFEALLTRLKFARKQYVAAVRAGRHRSSYSAETAGDHFALAWVNDVYGKLSALVPKGEDDIPSASDGRDIIAVEAQDNALIYEYLAKKGVGKARKTRDVDIDLNAQVAGMLAGRRVDLHAGIARGGEDTIALSPTA